MRLPDWIAALTNAHKFAGPSGVPTFGDALQGIGHSMMQHYRGRGGNIAGPTMPQPVVGPPPMPGKDPKAKPETVMPGGAPQVAPPLNVAAQALSLGGQGFRPTILNNPWLRYMLNPNIGINSQ